ncbi:cell wall-binding repeat-containing protein [Paraclostridium bifermentans]|uniref:Cell wall-binding repeat-containing protein n=1 Tax=Paraclostridium bifermentans TaxID=1490 RepID=A0ABY8R524_PARBF|nr:cell wall-binding repeat-containing protein [Paraclostridium bifermentans]
MERLGVKNVYIIGTDDVVSDRVNQEVKSMGISTERLGGVDRYETALKIVKKMDSIKDISQIAIVNGMNGLADAVSIASVAATNNMAIVPISPENGTKAFDEFIQSENISKSYIIGTDDVVPTNIKKCT